MNARRPDRQTDKPQTRRKQIPGSSFPEKGTKDAIEVRQPVTNPTTVMNQRMFSEKKMFSKISMKALYC
jgi:hypothetical protein